MKLGIAGSGMIVQEFLSIAPFLHNTEVSAICGRKTSEKKVMELAGANNLDKVYFDYEEFLNSSIDTVYVAVTNSLHYIYTLRALEAGKNVILEKPITTNYKEALELGRIAREKKLFLLEAITTLYLPNFMKIREMLPSIGNVKIVQCNYSQYSKRYDSFKEGVILPAFDPAQSGGALMDINIYNLHYVTALFGRPKDIAYYPNIERGIDTSGILILDYDTFKCTCIGAKDCKAPIAYNIQGDKGCIHQSSPANVCEGFEVLLNNGENTSINENKHTHRMVNEFLTFEKMIAENKLQECYQILEHSLMVSELLTEAREKTGIIFPSDFNEELLTIY